MVQGSASAIVVWAEWRPPQACIGGRSTGSLGHAIQGSIAKTRAPWSLLEFVRKVRACMADLHQAGQELQQELLSPAWPVPYCAKAIQPKLPIFPGHSLAMLAPHAVTSALHMSRVLDLADILPNGHCCSLPGRSWGQDPGRLAGADLR